MEFEGVFRFGVWAFIDRDLIWEDDALIHTLRYLVKMRFSEYHDVRASEGVLDWSAEGLDDLAGRLGLDAEVLTDQLTINKSRSHWLIRF